MDETRRLDETGRLTSVVTRADVDAAALRIAGKIARTPSVRCDAISRATGADVWLKLDSLQAIGSFKERGAANRMALLTAAERARGVVAYSAGNHAQAVARQASLLGIDAVIVMPVGTPATKVTRTAAWGARVVLHGEALAEAEAEAARLVAEGRVLIHPYADPAVIAGGGTLAQEFCADVPGLDVLLVPTGGGGLVAGCALATDIPVIGVEVESFAAYAHALHGAALGAGGPTIAEGIAVRAAAELPLSILRDRRVEVLTVPEAAIEAAIGLLVEGAKLVAEGAGAAGIAALLVYGERFRGMRVGVPICGGNIDARMLSNVMLRNLLRDGRLLELRMQIPDRPGVLADIAGRIGAVGGNIIEVSHSRLFQASLQAAELEVLVEARDAAQADAVIASLSESYAVRRS